MSVEDEERQQLLQQVEDYHDLSMAFVVACLSNDLRGMQMETGGDDEAPKWPGRYLKERMDMTATSIRLEI